MSDWGTSAKRMDWRSMFVYDPSTGIVRLWGKRDPVTRQREAAIMWARKERYREWLRSVSREVNP